MSRSVTSVVELAPQTDVSQMVEAMQKTEPTSDT